MPARTSSAKRLERQSAPTESVPLFEERPGSPIPPRHRVPSFLAQRFHQLCLGILAEVVEPAGLKLKEYGALTVLHGEPGIEQRRLASILGIDQVSAGQMLERLEQRGLVDRRAHPTDRRVRALFLTPAGLDLRLRLRPAGLAAQQRILAPLRPEEREVLVDLLTRVVDGHGIYVRPGNGRNRPRKRPTGLQPAEPAAAAE